jgi:hypothetical protein
LIIRADLLRHRGFQRLCEVGHYLVGPVRAQLFGLPNPVDTDYPPERAGPPGGHSGQGTLEDRRRSGLHT